MSLMEKIENIMKTKNYLYHRIVNHIYETQNNYIKDDQTIIQDFLNNQISIFKSYTEQNNIEIVFKKNENNTSNKIKIYLEQIIQFMKNKNENLRVIHVNILNNLLTPKIGKKITNLKNKTIFTIYDFIVNYVNEASKKLFKKDFDQKDLDKLNDLYLCFIFQIKDTENLKKLQILIYKYLYEENDINKFIENSSIEIISIDSVNDKKLKEYEIKYNEFKIHYNKTEENTKSFFGVDLKKNISDLLKFFNHKNIIDNSTYTNPKDMRITLDQIVIDDLNYNKKKIHLFSPEFLIVNGLKSQLKESDFEIFNEGNYSIDTFTNFLLKTIQELNISMKENNFENNFIDEHSIKFNRKENLHFISAKYNYNDIITQNKMKEDVLKNSFIKISIYQNKNNKNSEILENKIEDNNINNVNKEDINVIDEDNDVSLFSYSSISEVLKNRANEFEDLINKILTKNIKKENLSFLPNILFIFNLKIPKYNELKNSIEFKSAHLDFIKDNNNNDNKSDENQFAYGFKEIDVSFKNNSKDVIEVDFSNYFI